MEWKSLSGLKSVKMKEDERAEWGVVTWWLMLQPVTQSSLLGPQLLSQTSPIPFLTGCLFNTDFLCRPQSGVDGDDFTPSTSDQQDALQPLSQNLQELHVWVGS